MKVFLINLDRDSDRLQYMDAEIKAQGLEYERIPACLGLDIPDKLKGYFLGTDGKVKSALKNGEVGCYATHLRILQRIVDDAIDEPVLVLEDDLIFQEVFGELLSNLDQLPEDWELIRLSNPSKSSFETVSEFGASSAIVTYWRVPNNTGAYLINRAGAQKFLQYAGLRKRAIDEDLRRPWEHKIKTYGVLSAPITSNIFDSSIDELSGKRDLPARKRFMDAPNNRIAELSYRLNEFGLIGCLYHIVRTQTQKKKNKC
ncbi:glycosyltransferase family 25 protein [Pseudovibrio sp. Tun.PSC04-5.I4]|uniref:glycosyltransferase family 25 protein n=1 Tax=Pseudovibrio sp. Tun.PSC04-5.I4 TaxID=1798213 RepID=UPI0008845A24|nr:glycosyltransferase family 25 protein [Pseudovibrio sp. Tun.PSC04-5.I4]SDR47087.1 glycosyl transferase, family 25 [Pseudovibrio sp. Tun.PSC04-5.I4]